MRFSRKQRKALRLGGIVAGLLAATLLVGALVSSILGDADRGKRPIVHNVAILRPPPPPPPPKPPEQKPPEPELKKEEVKIPEPEAPKPDQAEAPPPGEQLGVDAAGGAGGDSFGLVGRPGGQDITTIGGGSGAGGSGYGLFASALQQHIQSELARHDSIRKENYRITVRLWISRDGRIEKSELVSGTGKSETDSLVLAALGDLPPLRTAMPDQMPQPVRIRITSR